MFPTSQLVQHKEGGSAIVVARGVADQIVERLTAGIAGFASDEASFSTYPYHPTLLPTLLGYHKIYQVFLFLSILNKKGPSGPN
jgi:hypothetical protein